MIVNTFEIKANEFKYPSKEERCIAKVDFPNFSNFGFEYKSEFVSILKEGKTLFETNRSNNLYWWDICLQNKIGKLNNAYINAITNYNRSIPENTAEFEKNNYLNKIQFDFYTETLYYFLFSVRDIILQIINVYYKLKMNEYDVCLRKLKKKKLNGNIISLLVTLVNDLDSATKIRNAFTHRFPINQADYRTIFTKRDEKEILAAGTGKKLTPKEIMSNINKSLPVLSKFLEQLKKEMNIKHSR
ncbi:MAG: hypothetical protein K8S23_10495 [Candidatus Cloacimonetes bacterium]|nr:hypothetical protein [Candidatus Cloacimonadota bacterium]